MNIYCSFTKTLDSLHLVLIKQTETDEDRDRSLIRGFEPAR